MEAAFRAGFLFVKRFRAVSLESFENGWKKGYSTMVGFELSGAGSINKEYRYIAVRTRQFAKRHYEEEWVSAAQLKSCDQVLSTDEAPKS